MIVFKKVRIFALFTLLTVSFAGLLQGSEESANYMMIKPTQEQNEEINLFKAFIDPC